MGEFLIKPHRPDNPRIWDNTFLWKEDNVYIMINHRLALWCWLQCEDVFKKEHALIHIDEHTDARCWEAEGEQESLKEILSIFEELKDLERYESFQCPSRDVMLTGRKTRPSITYDNFVHLAAEARLFDHYFIYSSVGDWHTSLPTEAFSYKKRVKDIYNLAESINTYPGKCIVDIDLDFFDDENNPEIFPKKASGEGILTHVCEVVAKNRNKISMITISLNESVGDQLWEKRQYQLSIVKEILGLEVPVPIMN